MPSSKQRRRSEDIATAPFEVDPGRVRRARTYRRLVLALVAVFLIFGLTSLLGARTAEVTTSNGGYDLTVVYPQTTRPGLAVRWVVLVHRAAGFDKPIEIATTSTYFNLFDFNNLDPTPSELTTGDGLSIWKFEPPPGQTFRVTMDARLEPARQHGSKAATSLRVDGVTIATVEYQTKVMP